MPVVQKSGVVATLGEFGDWERVTGGIPTTAYTEHYEAGAREPEQIEGTSNYTDLVLERAYDPTRDTAVDEWHQKFRAGNERERRVTKQIRNYSGQVVKSETYRVKPASFETPEGQAGSNEIAMCRLTCKVIQKL